jgi:DNA-binding MarR family transcriptional regulator
MESISVPTPRPDRGLTATQRRALLAMARDAESGTAAMARGLEAGRAGRAAGPELDTAAIAEAAGLKPNGAALALRGLERRGLVRRDAADPAFWTVTFLGHGLVKRLTREP